MRAGVGVLWVVAAGCVAGTESLGADGSRGRDATSSADTLGDDDGGRTDAANGDASSSPDGGSTAEQARVFCERSLEAGYARIAECHRLPPDYPGRYHENLNRPSCEWIEASVAAGRTTFDRRKTAACLEWVAAARCRELTYVTGYWPHLPWSDRPSELEAPHPCAGVVAPSGSSEPGSCRSDGECPAGTFCDNARYTTGQCSYACVPYARLEDPRERCDHWLRQCPAGYQCRAVASDLWGGRGGECYREGRNGEACAEASWANPRCEYGTACDAATQQCLPAPGPGSACPIDADYFSYVCAPLGLSCVGPQGGPATCREPGKPGEPCAGLIGECEYPYTYCQLAGTSTVSGVCAPFGVPGDPCQMDGPTPRLCRVAAECSTRVGSGVCVDFYFLADGSPCARSNECRSFHCADGICRGPPPRQPEGGACASDDECQSDKCSCTPPFCAGGGTCVPSPIRCPPPP